MAAQGPVIPTSTAASELLISDMGPPARKTASLAAILESGALGKTHKAPVAHLQQPRSSLGNSRAGVQSTEAGASAAASDATAARAGQQQAASSCAQQVTSDTPPILPCMPPEAVSSRAPQHCVWHTERARQASAQLSFYMTAKGQRVGIPACCDAS